MEGLCATRARERGAAQCDGKRIAGAPYACKRNKNACKREKHAERERQTNGAANVKKTLGFLQYFEQFLT